MEIFDLSNSEYSNRNGSYGGAAGDKDGIVINGEPWITKYPGAEYISSSEKEDLKYQLLGSDALT